MKWVIFDLDGTLADITKRCEISTLPSGKMDWDRFFDPENIELDEPNIPVIEACKAMEAHAPVEGLFLCSKPGARFSAVTAKWARS